MDVSRDHIVHSRAGKLGAQGVSTEADVKRILKQASDATPRAGLIIHFHGGLVSEKSARVIAQTLAPRYDGADAYPLFFVWESGLIETLSNNLGDIKDDKVFREFVTKVAQWVIKKLPGAVTTKGAGGATVDKRKLRKGFDDWFEGRATEPPVPLGTPDAGPALKGTAEPDVDDLAENINAEIDTDESFQEVMAGLYVASKRGSDAKTKGGQPAAADVEALVDQRALEEMFPSRTRDKTKGVLSWIKVARFVAKIVVAVIKRRLRDRDHGTYTTIVEEVLRAAYIDKVGTVVWNSMKKDTADAFASDSASVGTAVVAGLKSLADEGKGFKRIVLVGHSTGAIYINHLIEYAATALPGMKFDVVLLAPASRFEDFSKVLKKHPDSISNLRMFAMTDALESDDKLVPIIYPRSLLYFVSGLLEGDIDTPILGMQRFINLERVFDEANFPPVDHVRKWLAMTQSRSIWSEDTRVNGLGSKSHKHGDFDNDQLTVDSVCWILKHGYA